MKEETIWRRALELFESKSGKICWGACVQAVKSDTAHEFDGRYGTKIHNNGNNKYNLSVKL